MYEIIEIKKGESLYPAWLASIMAPPPKIWVKGNIDLLLTPPGVSIVGSRDCSKAGLEIARRLSAHITQLNLPVVSGLALGIDAAAHQGCIDAGGKTIAVLASGLHEATPKSNSKLGAQILETGGLWVSEHPPGTPARRQNFVPRNRIQVGLSRCSIVVESSEKSGTTTHAKFCVDEKHPLFAVLPQQGNPLNLNYLGPQMLHNTMGAIPITSKNDYIHMDNIIIGAQGRVNPTVEYRSPQG